MIIDTTPDGIRVRRKTAAEQEEEARAAKRRKPSNRIVMNIPTGTDEEVQAAFAKAAEEQERQLEEVEGSVANGPGQSGAADPDPENDVEWEPRAAGVRDAITEMVGGKEWLSQKIGDVGAIMIRGNGGLCAVKNAIKAAQKLPSVKAKPKDGKIPELVCKILLREFREVRRSVKGKSYNTWYMANFAKGDFDKVTKILKQRGDTVMEDDSRPPPFPEPGSESPEPTVRRLVPYYGEAAEGEGLHHGDSNQNTGDGVDYQHTEADYPPTDEQLQNGAYEHDPQVGYSDHQNGYQEGVVDGVDGQVYIDTDGTAYQAQDGEYHHTEGGQQHDEVFHEHEQEVHQQPVEGDFHPQDLAHIPQDSEPDAVEAIMQSQTNVQHDEGEDGAVTNVHHDEGEDGAVQLGAEQIAEQEVEA